MKKIKILLSCLLAFMFLAHAPTFVHAAGVTTSVSAPSTVSTGQSFTVKFSLNAGETIRGFTAKISYSSDLLAIEKVSKSDGSDNFNTSTGSFSSARVLSGSSQFLAITFKPKSAFTVGKSAYVYLNDFVAANDAATERLTASDKTVKITAVAPKSSNNNLSSLKVDGTSVVGFSASKTSYNLGSTDKTSINVSATTQDARASISGTGTVRLAYGSNTVRVVVKAENGSTKTYSIYITRTDNRSSNNYLSSIELSSGSIDFDKERNNYTYIVDHEVTKLTINATKEDSKASLSSASITKDLEIYSNMFTFKVVAENNSERVYTINVVRRDEDGYAGSLNTNNNLASLSVEGYELNFDPATLTYNLDVEHVVKTLSVLAEVEDDTASLILPESFDLELGDNAFELVVIAQDETKKVYQLNVFRARNIAPLPIDELIEQLDTLEADILNVALIPNQVINNDQLSKLRDTNKDVAFVVLDEKGNSLGYWKLSSDQLDVINTFNPIMRTLDKIPESLNERLNYAQSLVLSFDHEGEYEQPIPFVLYLQGAFDEGFLMNVYYYNEETNKLENVAQDISIMNDSITWNMEHASLYVVTPATFSSGFSLDALFDNSSMILIGLFVLLSISLFGNLLLLLRVKKLNERLFARAFHHNENQGLAYQEKPTPNVTQKPEEKLEEETNKEETK